MLETKPILHFARHLLGADVLVEDGLQCCHLSL